jgi:hypothetical protein
VTPEPSSWLLALTGIGVGALGLRRRFQFAVGRELFAGLAVVIVGLMMAPHASAQSVLTVPWDPTNPAAPHTAYSGATIVLGATFNTAGSSDSFKYQWNFGDNSSSASAAVTNPNDVSASHVYSVEADGATPATVGYTWTAVLTVTDTSNSKQYTGTYLVIWENNTLQTRVNVTIDKGLWYLHQSMDHPTATTGYWDACATGYTSGYDCSGYGSLTATNVQSMEVNGHLANEANAATDPLAIDVTEGLASLFTHLSANPLSDLYSYYVGYTPSKTYDYNPAQNNFGCSDGTAPTTTLTGTAPTPTSTPARGYCDAGATEVFYNPSATSCSAPPCTFTFDGNSNNYAVFAWQQAGNLYGWGYEAGMYADALVASGNPSAMATIPIYTGGTLTESYKDIVQDIADAANFCQWNHDTDVESGDIRGYPYGGNTGQGGGWWYECTEGNDGSVSQWASIGLIAGQRGFGLAIPPIITDANNLWVTSGQDVQSSKPTKDSWTYGTSASEPDGLGSYGYNGSLYYSNAWGPFAVTPSGMVQMSLDGIGRTPNAAAFGDSSTSPDQRFNNAETFYADNFCNATSGGATDAPRAYYYGLFSFTKAMLLHNPAGSLSPIQYLRTQTPNVFTTNSSIPANTIDWYAALSSANGGTDPCDGVAQTIIDDLQPTSSGSGYWNGDNYYYLQQPYETAWALIMLQRTVFVNCVNNLSGQGISGTAINPARADLTWTGIPNVTGYNILVSTNNGGPYNQVTYNGGTTTLTAFADETGLTNGSTYYFVLQPINNTGAVCQSNQAKITIPKPR